MGRPIDGTLFISYRRDDAAGWAGRLESDLRSRLGTGIQVFMDVADIPAGDDFAKAIDDAVRTSDALVALIGPGWTTVQDADGRRRLDNPNDFVRIELDAALRRGIRVIPALVGGASLPRQEELPESLQGLTRRQAVRLDNETWSLGLSKLLRAIEAPSDRSTRFAQLRPHRTSHSNVIAASLVLAAIAIAVASALAADRAVDRQAVIVVVGVATITIVALGLLLTWYRYSERARKRRSVRSSLHIAVAAGAGIVAVAVGGILLTLRLHGVNEGSVTEQSRSTKTELTAGQYQAQLSQICLDGKEEARRVVELKAQATRFGVAIKIEQDEVNQVKALAPPDQLSEVHEKMIAVWERRVGLLESTYQRLAQLKDNELESELAAADRLAEELARDFKSLGVPECVM